jgi:hypothetical protein
MALTVTKSGGNTTIKFELIGLSTKLDAFLDKWAQYAWDAGFGAVDVNNNKIAFSNATTAQKLAALNKKLKQLAVDETNTLEGASYYATNKPTLTNLDDVS